MESVARRLPARSDFIRLAVAWRSVAEKLKDAVTAYVADRSQDFKQSVRLLMMTLHA
mgnify:CR=1 FL=1